MGIRFAPHGLHLRHDMPNLLQDRLVHPPVRWVVPLLLLGQQLADPGEKTKRIRRAIEHVGQTQVIRMLVQMPVVIANKADRTAADGIGLTIEDVNTRALLHDDNFMEIMVMFRKGRLREAGFNSHRRDPGLKEIRTVQYGHDATLVMRKIISHRLIVMKGWLSGLQFLTMKFVNPAAFSRISRKDTELRTPSHPPRHPLKPQIVISLTVTFAFLPAASFDCP